VSEIHLDVARSSITSDNYIESYVNLSENVADSRSSVSVLTKREDVGRRVVHKGYPWFPAIENVFDKKLIVLAMQATLAVAVAELSETPTH
jgi:hypothetical protein